MRRSHHRDKRQQTTEGSMVLTGTGTEPVRSAMIFGYAIEMMFRNHPVRVIVRDEVLQKLAASPDNEVERLSQILGKYRSQIEGIASQKHSAGQIESNGSILIAATDV